MKGDLSVIMLNTLGSEGELFTRSGSAADPFLVEQLSGTQS